MIRIMTDAKLSRERSEWTKYGYDQRKDEEARGELRKKFEKFRDIPITLISVTLAKGPEYNFSFSTSFGGSEEFISAEYDVKFRFFNGTESGIKVHMDTPDFSMVDIRRKISGLLLGDICGGDSLV